MTEEPGGETALLRLGPGGGERGGSEVDARHVQAAVGAHQHVFTGAAADVQHPAVDRTGVGQGEERRLRPADVPRGPLPGVQLVGLPPEPEPVMFFDTPCLRYDDV